MSVPTNSRGQLIRDWQRFMRQTRVDLSGSVTTMASGNVDGRFAIDLLAQLRGILTKVAAFRADAQALAGVVDAYRADVGDPTLDIVAEVDALVAAINTVRGTMHTAVNTRATAGTLLLGVDTGTDVAQWAAYTPSQTAGLRTQLTAVTNAINISS